MYINGEYITPFRFADDIVVMTESTPEVADICLPTTNCPTSRKWLPPNPIRLGAIWEATQYLLVPNTSGVS